MSRHPARRFRSWTCCTLMVVTASLGCNVLTGASELDVVDTFDAGGPVTPDRSMVAMGFGGAASNFSAFDETVAENFTFSPYVSWSHLIGHAQGAAGLQFTANVGGDWQAKAIELQPN